MEWPTSSDPHLTEEMELGELPPHRVEVPSDHDRTQQLVAKGTQKKGVLPPESILDIPFPGKLRWFPPPSPSWCSPHNPTQAVASAGFGRDTSSYQVGE